MSYNRYPKCGHVPKYQDMDFFESINFFLHKNHTKILTCFLFMILITLSIFNIYLIVYFFLNIYKPIILLLIILSASKALNVRIYLIDDLYTRFFNKK